MKSKWVWVAAIVVVLLLAGGAFGYYKFASHTAAPMMATEEHGGAFNSIQEALMKSLSLKCDYSQDSNTQVLAYIKNGQVRSIITVKDNPNQSGNAIIKPTEKKVYYWNGKTGYMMTLPEVTVTPSAGSSAAQPEDKGNSVQSMWENLEKFKKYCQVASIDDSLFVLPKDVTFQDMSKMMPSSAPSGVPSGMPTGMNSEDIQKMMQQYKAPTGY